MAIYDTLDLEDLNVELADNSEDLTYQCDALVLVTDWAEFREIDYHKLASLMRQAILIDGRNYLDVQILTEAGFDYIGIGKSRVERVLRDGKELVATV